MRRRTLLATLGTGTAAFAGCLSSPGGDPTVSEGELPPVTVTYRWSGGLSPVASTTLTVDRGTVGWATTCRRDEAFGIDVERPLDEDAYVDVQRRVVRSEPRTWEAEYPCRDVCATDDGTYDLSVTVDGTPHETSIDPARERPGSLLALLDRLDEIAERFRDLDHCHLGDR